MHKDNLYKGFEVELFTGSYNNHVGVSDDIEKIFSNFVKEPDKRNVEYITKLVQDHLDSKKDSTFRVWSYYCFQKWYKFNFLQNANK